MHNQTYFQERIDKLAMLYIENHYDISKMSVSEFVKTFYNIYNEINDLIKSSDIN